MTCRSKTHTQGRAAHGRGLLVAGAVILCFGSQARAGLYYSGEQVAELPSQWRGYLLDQRLLRTIPLPPRADAPANPLRTAYQQAAEALAAAARKHPLSADEAADLGALYLRLGKPANALDVLRDAQRRQPHHFRVTANLGTAWQMQGDLRRAAAALEESVRLAPGAVQRAEEAHLRLVRCRLTQPGAGLDDLFGVRFSAADGGYVPGTLPGQQKTVPADAVAVVQHLGLWLPADGPLLWLLGELAAAHGDFPVAASIMDGCVTELGMSDPELRRHRRAVRDAADALAKTVPAAGDDSRAVHQGHAGAFKPRSQRPLLRGDESEKLPPIVPGAVTALPWAVISRTTVDRRVRPTFPGYLTRLDGTTVEVAGFMQPLGDARDAPTFMLIEYPVGCWYCETPGITGIVFVELKGGRERAFTRNQIKVTGTLELNRADPEQFLYTLKEAKVAEVD